MLRGAIRGAEESDKFNATVLSLVHALGQSGNTKTTSDKVFSSTDVFFKGFFT